MTKWWRVAVGKQSKGAARWATYVVAGAKRQPVVRAQLSAGNRAVKVARVGNDCLKMVRSVGSRGRSGW